MSASSSGPHGPPTLAMSTALARNDTLGQLLQRLSESRENLEVVRGLLPPGLADEVRAGPLDAQGWTLLVPGAAAGAKLRQLLPRMEAELLAHRHRPVPVRIRIVPPAR
jgi:hypothetical protein